MKMSKSKNRRRKREIGCGFKSCLTYIIVAVLIVLAVWAVKTYVISEDTRLDIFNNDSTETEQNETDLSSPQSPEADGSEEGSDTESETNETSGSDISDLESSDTQKAEEPIDKVQAPESLDVDVYSHNLLLVNLTDNIIMAGKNSSERAYPASVTKIMTAIVAIENIEDIQDVITLDAAIYDYTTEQNAVTSGYIAGETVSIYELLYGMMLPSGADAALALAQYVAGSEHDFADMMNAKAKELGMDDTHFTNCTGLHDDQLYSSTYDIYILLKYSLQNELFRSLFTASRHSSTGTDKHPDGITVRSTMFNAITAAGYENQILIGGKTGYTPQAGRCLASLASYEGKEYILVTFGAGTDVTYPIIDAFTVYNHYLGIE